MLAVPNRALWFVTAGALAFLALALYVPALNDVFLFAELGPGHFGLAVAVGIASIIWFEGLKAGSRL